MIEIINSDVMEFKTDEMYHAIISDPPYNLKFMNRQWDTFKTPLQYQQWVTEWSSHLMQFLYPGAICAFFGGTRTYHRLATGLEDAGYEIFDSMIWCYGSGFPKSYNISKGIDKSLGLEREIVGYRNPYLDNGKRKRMSMMTGSVFENESYLKLENGEIPIYQSNHDWNGYGTAIKPAYEPIILCRKPLEKGGYVNSVLKYGTSGLNIDGGRISTNGETTIHPPLSTNKHEGYQRPWNSDENIRKEVENRREIAHDKRDNLGRFPANFGLICDCEKEPCECVQLELDNQSGIGHIGHFPEYNKRGKSNVFGKFNGQSQDEKYLSKGGASRFFYTAKASSKEREVGLEKLPKGYTTDQNKWTENDYRDGNGEKTTQPRGNNHPTVKPIKLIEYLATLLLPPIENSNLLIPFSGVGSEIIGSHLAGWDNITGIEIDDNYVNIANKRLEYWTQYDNYDDALKSKKLVLDKQLELL